MGQFSAGEVIVKRKKTPLWMRLFVGLTNVLTIWLFFSSIMPFFSTPFARLEMFFTYPPRFIYLFPVGLLIAFYSWRRMFVRLFIVLLTFLLLIFHMGLGGGARTPVEPYYTLLSFNVHDATDQVDELAELCRNKNVDILVLQEVKKENRAPFIDALPDYRFFWADENKPFKYDHTWPFSSMIGIKKELITGQIPYVETAITDFRTFALNFALDDRPVWIVNVHMVKAFSSQSGLAGYTKKLPERALRHIAEGELLKGWVLQHQEHPVIVSGDFNAPYYAKVLDLPGMSNAHLESGGGFHRTFPRSYPVWGIDHTLVSQPIDVFAYEFFDAGFSDHLAQLMYFGFTKEQEESED